MRSNELLEVGGGQGGKESFQGQDGSFNLHVGWEVSLLRVDDRVSGRVRVRVRG